MEVKPMSDVYITQRTDAEYPRESYNPSCSYPEYVFPDSELSTSPNHTYDMVRECLAGIGLDSEHFGGKDWNPLGDIIKPGQTVLIKPNLVMDKNGNGSTERDSFDCMTTNTGCVRAICDYCLIALQGQGNIIIGDAPMQGCQFDKLVVANGLQKMVDFYNRMGIRNITIVDLREFSVNVDERGVLRSKKYNGEASGVTVQLGDLSMHHKREYHGAYCVSDYESAQTNAFHNKNAHSYVISRYALEADVIINFCKPKTHRLAGFTGAMKNTVGVVYNKACLPHRVTGSKKSGGDAYQNPNIFKMMAEKALAGKIYSENRHWLVPAFLMRCFAGGLLTLGKMSSKDSFFMGSWYGNDTIWRTICDLNYILNYADKQGNIQNTLQRSILNIGDMIIAGEGNGPVKPTPKKLNAMIISMNGVAFDLTLCNLMGFSHQQIPLTRAIVNGNTLFEYTMPGIKVIRNGACIYSGKLTDNVFGMEWQFKPHDDWKNLGE